MSDSSMFEWDEENVGHIARHGVSVEDVEYALSHPTLDYGYQDWHDEDRFAEVGQTLSGRVLMIISTVRGKRLRVVTAFDADDESKQEYLRSR